MVQLPQQRSDRPELERYHIEYVEVATDEAAANEPLRKAISEKLRRGWKLVSLTVARVDRSSGVATLTWDTSGT